MSATDAFVEASQTGNTRRLSALLKKGADPNLRDKTGWTPLHWAVQEGKEKAAKLLIDAGALVDAADTEGFTPLQLAVGNGYLTIVRLLIANGAVVNRKCKAHQNGTPLHSASAWGHFGVAKVLISAGANVNATDSERRTPLAFALKHGHAKIVKLLLDNRGKLS